ncbi:hypothetical protein niasHS_015355 [Heterodera schachtii]|uniref:Uncharacterized protein n=1 Tax=Heterodera schachtii TaxID=97005 RepID=A0ABD2I9K2_HETSC
MAIVTKTVLRKPSATTTTFERVERKYKVMSGGQKNNFTTSWAWINDLMNTAAVSNGSPHFLCVRPRFSPIWRLFGQLRILFRFGVIVL